MSDFYNKYPYTDFHELNLDWVIERVKKLTEDWAATLTEWNNTEEEWQQLYDYVHDYFDNLDVQQEINNKIDQMILDGTFATIASPIIENQVITTTTAWLAAHISQPTTPAIDNTLSIASAGADAQKTGLLMAPVYDGTLTYTNGDYVNHNGTIYRCKQDITTPEAWNSGKWQSISYNTDAHALFPIVITSGDLDDFVAGGSEKSGYYLGNANSYTYTNLPSEITGNFVLQVMFAPTGTHTLQIISGYPSSNSMTNIPVYYRSHVGYWTNWIKTTDPIKEVETPAILAGGNLNDIVTGGTYKQGYYRGVTGSYVYTNLPSGLTGNFLLQALFSASGTHTIQIINTYPADNMTTKVDVYFRSYVGYWTNWIKLTDPVKEVNTPVVITSGDLNNFVTGGSYAPGYYRGVAGTYPYSNIPAGFTGNFILQVLFSPSGTHTIQIFYGYPVNAGTDASIYLRAYTGIWSSWIKVADSNYNNRLDEVTNAVISSSLEIYSSPTIAAVSSQGENTGTAISVMSYNVANYNNDTATYIDDDKVLSFRQMLNDIEADLICTQEDRDYIDADSLKSAAGYLYNPVYPNDYIETTLGVGIRSRLQADTNGNVDYSNGRKIEYATYTINTKTLLVLSTHPVANYNSTGVDSPESIAARLTQYTELFDWLTGDIQLSGIPCPSYDWAIIGGDFNTITASDRTNLTTQVSSNGFIMANGDRLGWLYTNMLHSWPLDNIIVSSNVIINSFRSYVGRYDNLYSDHVPILAKLTLTD